MSTLAESPTRLPAIADVIATIEDRGYCVIPNVISPEEADAVRAVVNDLLLEERQPRHIAAKTQRVGRIAVKHPIFRDLLCNPFIVELWQSWLGADMIASTWTSNTIFPGIQGMGWHADFPYWSMKAPWPTGNLSGQTIWMLDDFTDENGGTGVIPGSHRRLAPPPDAHATYEDAAFLTGTRGSVAVLHGAIWHQSRPNRTDGNRTALLGMYNSPAIVTQEDMRGQLADIPDPSPLLRQIMGANAYRPHDLVG